MLYFKNIVMKTLLKAAFVLFITPAVFSGCSSTKGPRVEVPMAINVRADNSVNFTDFNANYYRLNVKDILDDFQEVYPTLVDDDENPEIIVDITIENMHIGVKDRQAARRVFSRNIQVGTDTRGQPVYQTITASADIVQTQIPADARISTRITFKGTPDKIVNKSYFANHRWQNLTVENVQGDQRAIDPSLMSRVTLVPDMDPNANDLMLTLSKEDMLRDLSNEIRRYYQK
jgi:hypothetical protein